MSGVNQSVSAGIGGFLVFFLLAGALWLLMRNMNTRLQNLSYNEQAQAGGRGPTPGSRPSIPPRDEPDPSAPTTPKDG